MIHRIPLWGAGLRRKSAFVTAQHRQNVYADVQPVEDRTRIAFHGTAGLTEVLAFGGDPSRGWIAIGDYLYSVHGITLYRPSLSGSNQESLVKIRLKTIKPPYFKPRVTW